ncbi:MAG: M48 family metallopeptidase [Armatimonadetes bacterium]|nr:M48 family metallopeptidase [Armatimonadota bacterium]
MRVDAPEALPVDVVVGRVERRGAWILRQWEHYHRLQPGPTPRRYMSGETHRYLGRQYRLKIIEGRPEEVKLLRGVFRVVVREPSDRQRVERLMNRWFEQHGKAIIAERVERCYAAMRGYGVPEPSEVVYRRMQMRWGSCTKAGKVLLNTELAHVPVSCIDYVITHELCHLKHPNHSPAFYALLTAVMPDWRERKERLERALL